MPNYRFIGLTPRFYPDERGDDGRSLMALPGDVHDWSHTPDDGQWVLAGPPPDDPPADPEPTPDDFPAASEPAPAPDPVPAPSPAPEPVPPAPEPEPAPVTEPTPQAVLDWYANLNQTPPARA